MWTRQAMLKSVIEMGACRSLEVFDQTDCQGLPNGICVSKFASVYLFILSLPRVASSVSGTDLQEGPALH